MKFYQYWIILIIVLLVFISIYNITKMIVLISSNKDETFAPSVELNKNIRNLLISIALLSIISLVYIIIVFKNI